MSGDKLVALIYLDRLCRIGSHFEVLDGIINPIMSKPSVSLSITGTIGSNGCRTHIVEILVHLLLSLPCLDGQFSIRLIGIALLTLIRHIRQHQALVYLYRDRTTIGHQLEFRHLHPLAFGAFGEEVQVDKTRSFLKFGRERKRLSLELGGSYPFGILWILRIHQSHHTAVRIIQDLSLYRD